LRAEILLGSAVGEVPIVRWNPHSYLLAVGRSNVVNAPGDPHLHILNFNPITYALTQTSSAETNQDVFALAWRTTRLANGRDVLAVGRDNAGAQLVLYTVDSLGILSAPISPINTDGTISDRAIDWDATNQFVAVGVAVASSQKALQVYSFNPSGPSLTFAASTDVDTVPTNTLTMATVLAVDWNPTFTNLLEVGLQGSSGQLAQLFAFDSGASMLAFQSGITTVTTSVIALDWYKDGGCLAIGQSDGQFATYVFTDSTLSFSQASSFDDFGGMAVNDVRWSPKGGFIANGSDNNGLSVYETTCHQQTICDLISRISVLETCCDELRTSTGFLQSQIDIVSTDTLLFSLIEVLESCCDELKTSTGFLQSQIDIVSTDTLLFSLIEVLESCCDELKTSTGFLQSQIDV
ncbi:MAG: hypothetical protein P4M14_12400, partial [Gammaproteobacteria bacterium]|nr:hypothetical protein [Gammaproteobacteria bacterium]